MDKRCAKDSLIIDGQPQYGEWLKAGGGRVREKGFEKGENEGGGLRQEVNLQGFLSITRRGMFLGRLGMRGLLLGGLGAEREGLISVRTEKGGYVLGEEFVETEGLASEVVGEGGKDNFRDKGGRTGGVCVEKMVGEVVSGWCGVTPHSGRVVQGVVNKELGLERGDVWERSQVEEEVEGSKMCGLLAAHSLHEIQLMQVDVNGASSGVITEAALKGRLRKKGKGRRHPLGR